MKLRKCGNRDCTPPPVQLEDGKQFITTCIDCGCGLSGYTRFCPDENKKVCNARKEARAKAARAEDEAARAEAEAARAEAEAARAEAEAARAEAEAARAAKAKAAREASSKKCLYCKKSFSPKKYCYNFCSVYCSGKKKNCIKKGCHSNVTVKGDLWGKCTRHVPSCSFPGCNEPSDPNATSKTGKNSCTNHSVESSMCEHQKVVSVCSSNYGSSAGVICTTSECENGLDVIEGTERFETKSPMCDEHKGLAPNAKIIISKNGIGKVYPKVYKKPCPCCLYSRRGNKVKHFVSAYEGVPFTTDNLSERPLWVNEKSLIPKKNVTDQTGRVWSKACYERYKTRLTDSKEKTPS